MNDFVRSPKRGAFHMGLDDRIRSRPQAWGISYALEWFNSVSPPSLGHFIWAWMIKFGLAPKLGAFHIRLDEIFLSPLQAWGISYRLGCLLNNVATPSLDNCMEAWSIVWRLTSLERCMRAWIFIHAYIRTCKALDVLHLGPCMCAHVMCMRVCTCVARRLRSHLYAMHFLGSHAKTGQETRKFVFLGLWILGFY